MTAGGIRFAPPPYLSNDELGRRATRREALRRDEFENGAKYPSDQDIRDADVQDVARWQHAGLILDCPPKQRRGR